MKSHRRRALYAAALASLGPLVATTVSSASTTTTTINPGPPQVIVSAFSEKGDFIANGVSSVLTTHWSTVRATTTGVYLSNNNPAAKSFATFSFAPVAGETLAVGTYTNVQRAAYRSAGFPGIEITGPGRPTGCVRLSGSFQIWDVASDAAGTLTRLDLTYVEHCGAGRPANYGEVLINDAPHVGALTASARRIAFPDQTPTLPYVLINPTAQVQPVSLWQSATTVSHFTVTPASPNCATSVPAQGSCLYWLRLLPPRPGLYHATILVASTSATLRLPLSGPAGGV